MSAASNGLAYARTGRARFIAALTEFVRFASVGAQPKHADDVRINFLFGLAEIGCDALHSHGDAPFPVKHLE